MSRLTESNEARESFLFLLPNETLKKVATSTILLFLIGFIVSLVFVIIGVVIIETAKLTTKLSFPLMVFLQDTGFLVVTLLLFYRGSLVKIVPRSKEVKISNKLRLYLVIADVMFVLLFTFGVSIVSFALDRSGTLSWFRMLINLGEDKVTVSYSLNYALTVVTILFIAFSEELVFRHTLFRFFRRHGLVLSIFVSSVLFHIVHGQIIHIGFIYGMILCLYYEYTNDFKGLVLTHTIHNLLLTFVPFYTAHIFVWLFT